MGTSLDQTAAAGAKNTGSAFSNRAFLPLQAMQVVDGAQCMHSAPSTTCIACSGRNNKKPRKAGFDDGCSQRASILVTRVACNGN